MTRTSIEDRRRDLLAAAFRVVAERGLAAASTRAIVAEAEMSLASFHYAFTSRDELIDLLIAEVVAGERTAVVPEELGGKSLEQLIAEGLNGYLDHLRRDPPHEQAMLELAQFALRDRPSLARELYEQYHAIARASLDMAAEATGVHWSVDVDIVARLLVSVTDGLTLSWLVDRDDDAARTLVLIAARAVAALADESDRADG